MTRTVRCSAIFAVALMVAMTYAGTAAASATVFGKRADKQCPAAKAWVLAYRHDHPKLPPVKPSQPALAAELARRAAADQNARNHAIAAHLKGKKLLLAIARVDAANLAWLKQRVAQGGFPTLAQVGRKGMDDAWLLVDHADADPSLQMRVIKQLQARGQTGVKPRELATLTDRVLAAEGKPQRYGSQVQLVHGRLEAEPPIADPAHVDQRRARMGMMPLADYRCVLEVEAGLSARSAAKH